MTSIWVFFFAFAAGLTLSGFVANLYRVLGLRHDTRGGRLVRNIVLVVAGPSVLFENAAQAARAGKCPLFHFWIAAAVSAYWCLALGLLVLNIALAG